MGDSSLSFIDPVAKAVKGTIKAGNGPVAVAVAYAEPQPGTLLAGQPGVVVGIPGAQTVVTALPRTGGGGEDS